MRNRWIIGFSTIQHSIIQSGYEDVITDICKTYSLYNQISPSKNKQKRCSDFYYFWFHRKIKKAYHLIELNILRGNCITIAVWLFSLLLFAGFNHQICLGSKYEDYKLFAHMWVECDGKIFDLKTNKGKYDLIEKMNYGSIIEAWLDEVQD